MAFTPITGTVPQYSTADNELASGYYLKFYEAGTTTPLSVATDSTGGTLLAKIKLNARGLPITNPMDDDTVFIPHVDQAYRIVLYKNEADADANTTANAEFNIASVAPDIAPSADAADITLRTNNLEAWDDYDRSPLFVDGTDFTAGAGPHVITVPATWNPTVTGFRVWKLDAPSSTVIALTPTTDTSTTFTLAETLLSTDVIFIGDETFRNIHDGDPADIKSRLSLSDALLASNRFQEIEDAGAAAQLEARENIGAFSGNTVTSVWTGSSTSVNFNTDIAGGFPGNGFYIAEESTGARGLIFIVQNERMENLMFGRTITSDGIYFWSLAYSAANVLTIGESLLDASSGNSTASRTIVEILKVS